MNRARQVGLGLTLLAVLVLAGSLVAGIGRGRPPAAPLVTTPAAAPSRDRPRVEVLNAAGIPGLARDATERLRDRGFDVVYYGNAHGFSPDTSLVLARSDRPDAAAQVAHAIGISRVLIRPDTSLYLDVTVVLGKDWKS